MKIFIICALSIIFIVGGSFAQDKSKPLSGDALRDLLNPSERQHIEHEKELKSDQMHLNLRDRKKRPGSQNKDAANGSGRSDDKNTNIIPGQGASESGKSANPSDQGVEQGKGGGNNSVGLNNGQIETINKPNKTRSKKKGDRYIPPSWHSNRGRAKGGFKTDNVKNRKGPYFGIRLGKKIRAYLPQITTNVEQNLTEIRVSQDVFGDYKTMDKNTKIYCRKTLNPGSNRLELLAVKGITPKGEEFKLKGIVLDINNVAGLVGAISTDGKTAKRTLAAGVFGVGEALAPLLNDGSLVGAGVEAAAENTLKEKQTQSEKTLNNPSYTIYVNPQDIMIRVEETF